MAENKNTALDFSLFKGDLTTLLGGIIDDFTSEDAQEALRVLSNDWFTLSRLKASGADPALIKEAETALEARYRSVIQIPGLITAGRASQALAVLQNVGSTVINWGFAAIRTFAASYGIPIGTVDNARGSD